MLRKYNLIANVYALASSYLTRTPKYTHTAEDLRIALFQQQVNFAAVILEDTFTELENMGFHPDAIRRAVSRATINLRERQEKDKADG